MNKMELCNFDRNMYAKRDKIFRKTIARYTDSIHNLKEEKQDLKLRSPAERAGFASSNRSFPDLQDLKKSAEKLADEASKYIDEFTPKSGMSGFVFFRYVLGFLGFLIENGEPNAYIFERKVDSTKFRLSEHGPILDPKNSDMCIVDESNYHGKEYLEFVICPGYQEGTLYTLANEVLYKVLAKFADSLQGKEVEVTLGNTRVLGMFSIDTYNDGHIFFHIDTVQKHQNNLNRKLDALNTYLKTKMVTYPQVYTQLENAVSVSLKPTVEQDFVLVYDQEKDEYTERRM